MVATVKSISSSGNAARYFYFIENDFECSREWCDTRGKENLALGQLQRKIFEETLNGQITEIDAKGSQIITHLGRKTSEGLVHHPGQELIFSAPKSVSIMGLVAEDDRVLEAHEDAVNEIVRYLERTMIYTRIQKDGAMKLEKTDNILAAKFTHLTARPPSQNEGQSQKEADPQIHSHVIIPNATKCRDGVWRSVVFDSFYDNKMHLGELYRMELANNLQQLGYDIELKQDSSKHWTFELRTVPQEEIIKFSKRRQDILKTAEELGVCDAESMALIAKSTRTEKVVYNLEELKQSWQERSGSFTIPVGIHNEVKSHNQLSQVLDDSIEHLSEKESSWRREDLIGRVIEREGFRYTLAEIERKIEEYLNKEKLLQGYNSLTTKENLRSEQQCIELLQQQKNTVSTITHEARIAAGLSVGQQDAINLVLQTNDRIIGIQGSAGTGKTTVLNNIYNEAKNHGYQILGLSPTKSAAKNIEDVTQIKSQTLQLFLATYTGFIEGRGTETSRERIGQEYKNKIIVLDEASLSSTKQMKQLLELTAILKFRLVLMGDSKQLGSIEAGKPFYYLQNHGLNTALMNSIKRQQNPASLKAVYAIEQGVDKSNNEARSYITKGLKALGKENIIDVASQKDIVTNKDIAEAVYKKWQEYQNKEVLIVVPSNPLRREINLKIRNTCTSGGDYDHVILVNKDLSKIDKMQVRSYQIGDTVVFGKDDLRYKISKNSYWTVQEKPKDNLVLVNQEQNLMTEINPQNIKGRIEVYTNDTIQLAVGERIRWTRNSKENDFMINGNFAVITSISDKKIEIKTQDGLSKKLELENLKHIDYDYSTTTYNAQGKTTDHVIGVLKAKEPYLKLSTQRALYVAVSRAKHSATLVIDNYHNLLFSLAKRTGSKTSALEQINHDDYTIPKIRLGREVFISPKNSKNTDLKYEQSYSKVRSTYRSYDQADLKTKAIEMFGEINSRLSKNNQLRFGKKGSISVNLNTGQWYDFESGSGGAIKPESKYSANSTIKAQSKVVKNKGYNIDKLLENSVSIKENNLNPSVIYLEKHRNLDLSKINLSSNLKYSKKIWNSELKSYVPGLIAVAKNSESETKALQVIYLDANTSNKRNDITIKKRTIGQLKGAFVELTNNQTAKNIFIAEGIETGLSVAAAEPSARVLCSLGVSNMQNISLDFGQENTTIICADNDGASSGSRAGVERAAEAYKSLGAGSVAIIRPKIKGEDFNDVLKQKGEIGVKDYIEPLIAKDDCCHNQIIKIRNAIIEYQKEAEELSNKVGNGVYKDRAKSLENWANLVKEKGAIEAIKNVRNKPEILGELEGKKLLGISNETRRKAMAKVDENLKDMTRLEMVQKLIKIKQNQEQEIVKDFGDNHLQNITEMETKNLDHNELKMKLEMRLPYVTKASDNIIDITAVKRIAKQMGKQIINHREIYGKEPNLNQKKEYFYEARFAETERSKLALELSKIAPNKTTGERTVFEQKLEHLVAVNTSLSDKSSEFYSAEQTQKVMGKYIEKTNKIKALTKEYISSGMDKIKADFMANEVVKYEDKFGLHMPPKTREKLDKIGDYVSKSYEQFIKSGFSKLDARISYNEGMELILNKSDAFHIQKQVSQKSKQQFEMQQNDARGENKNEVKKIGYELEL